MNKEEYKIVVDVGYHQLIDNNWHFNSQEVPVPKNYNYVYISRPTKIIIENGKIVTTVVLSQEELSTLNIKTHCYHEYVTYHGLKDVFEYCIKCNEKKN